MQDLMVDIETLATSNDAVITQIGAVYFDRYTGESSKELLINVDIQSCLDLGLKVDGGALMFWYNHIPTWLDNTVSIKDAIQTMRAYYDNQSLVWAHSTFDFPIIANACKKIGMRMVFPYRNLRDIRTLVDLSGIRTKKEEGVDAKTHNALDDCKYQVKYCVECFNVWSGNEK